MQLFHFRVQCLLREKLAKPNAAMPRQTHYQIFPFVLLPLHCIAVAGESYRLSLSDISFINFG